MTETEILYDKNKNFLIVKCTNEIQEKFIKDIGGKIDTKTNNTWIVSINKELEIKNYNDSLKNTLKTILINNSKIVAKSRKLQKKYRRAVSESEDSSENENIIEPKNIIETKNTSEPKNIEKGKITRNKNKKVKSPSKIQENIPDRKLSPMETDIIDKIKLDQKIKFEKEKEEYEKNNPELYYKTFNNKPIEFKKINKHSNDSSDEDIYSSSSAGSESSCSFPSPRTPKRRKKYFEKEEDSYNNLFDEMKEMKKQLYELQIENKKLKSKNLK